MSAGETRDRLVAEVIQAALEGQIIGRQIVLLDSTTSTSDSLLDRAAPETPEGLVVFADRQTAGRGQRGNRWESPAGLGLWLSILLRPGIAVDRSESLTAWAAESVAKTIGNEFGLKARTKS